MSKERWISINKCLWLQDEDSFCLSLSRPFVLFSTIPSFSLQSSFRRRSHTICHTFTETPSPLIQLRSCHLCRNTPPPPPILRPQCQIEVGRGGRGRLELDVCHQPAEKRKKTKQNSSYTHVKSHFVATGAWLWPAGFYGHCSRVCVPVCVCVRVPESKNSCAKLCTPHCICICAFKLWAV